MSFGPICPDFSNPLVRLEYELCDKKREICDLKNQIILLMKVINKEKSFDEIENELLRIGFCYKNVGVKR